jgi:hypothetical protein
MEKILLNKSEFKREFELSSANSGIYIEQVRFIRTNDNPDVLPWTDFALRVEFRVKLYCTIYNDSKNRFVDERTKEFLIPLVPNIYQSEPVIHVNRRFENQVFKVGVNSEQKHFDRLSLEVCNRNSLSEDYFMEFLVEKTQESTNN